MAAPDSPTQHDRTAAADDAAAAARARAAALEAVIEQLSDGVVVVGRDGRTLLINDTARFLLGVGADVKSVGEYARTADVRGPGGAPIPASRWPLERALRGELVVNQEHHLRRADGVEAVVSTSAVPLVSDAGERWGAAVVIREMTHEARMRDRLEAERAAAVRRAREQTELATAAGELVGSLSVDEQLARLARRAHGLLGADYAAVATVDDAGWTTWRAVDGNRSDVWRAARFAPGIGTAGRVLAVNAPVVIRDFPDNPAFPPEEFPAHAAEGMRTALGVPMRREGRAFGTVIVGWRREAEVDEHAITLAQNLADLAALALAAARLLDETRRRADELERATSVKSRFFAQMSHELRTPINAILGYGGLMTEGLAGEMPPKALQMLDRVQRSARHLLELVNDVLDISRLEAGKVVLTPEDFDLVVLARDALASVEPQAAAKGLSLVVRASAPVPTHADQQRVRQILLNLLSNAVKFTERGGITVDVVPPHAAEPRVALCVTDTGMGIAPEDQERVFAEFEQVAGGHAASGTGLGLAITRRLALLLGGDVNLRSARGAGSTFTVWLPSVPRGDGDWAP